MEKWKKTALSLFLAGASLFPATKKLSAQTSQKPNSENQKSVYQINHIPKLNTLQDYLNLYNTELQKEAERRVYLFKNTQAQNIITKYGLDNERRKDIFHESSYPTDAEMEILRDAYLSPLEKALKETRHKSPDIEEFGDGLKALLVEGFYFTIKGPKANGHTNIPTLAEEKRQDKIETKSRLEILGATIKELGNKYRVELGGKFDYNLKGATPTKFIQGFETSIQINDSKILGQEIHSIKAKIDASQKLSGSITKLLTETDYLIFSTKLDSFPNNHDSTSISLIHEVPNSRFIISYTRDEKENIITMNLYKRF